MKKKLKKNLPIIIFLLSYVSLYILEGVLPSFIFSILVLVLVAVPLSILFLALGNIKSTVDEKIPLIIKGLNIAVSIIGTASCLCFGMFNIIRSLNPTVREYRIVVYAAGAMSVLCFIYVIFLMTKYLKERTVDLWEPHRKSPDSSEPTTVSLVIDNGVNAEAQERFSAVFDKITQEYTFPAVLYMHIKSDPPSEDDTGYGIIQYDIIEDGNGGYELGIYAGDYDKLWYKDGNRNALNELIERMVTAITRYYQLIDGSVHDKGTQLRQVRLCAEKITDKYKLGMII